MQLSLSFLAKRAFRFGRRSLSELRGAAPTPQHSPQMHIHTSWPGRLPGKDSGTQPPSTPPSVTLGGPTTSIQPPTSWKLQAPSFVFCRQAHLHDDSGTAIPWKTPDSPAPGRETKDTQWAPQAPPTRAGAEGPKTTVEHARRRCGAPGGLATPHTRHSHSSAASRPHCRDPTEFPVSDNDAISVRGETHNKPGPAGPRRTPRPSGQRPQRARRPPQDRPAGAAAHVPFRDVDRQAERTP